MGTPLEFANRLVEQRRDALQDDARRSRRRARPGGAADLTPRERQVLPLLAARYTDREIADELFISYRTATTHVASILGKLGIRSRRHVRDLVLRHDDH